MTDLQVLRELAHAFGVQTAYYDVSRKRQHASPESLLVILRQLGAPMEKISDAERALRIVKQRTAQPSCAPVQVIWEGTPGVVRIHLPRNGFDKLECHLAYGNGDSRSWTLRPEELTALDDPTTEHSACRVMGLNIPAPVPFGYHRLELAAGKFVCKTHLFAAPRKTYQRREKIWGIFVPPYALHSKTSWGAGSFSDLEATANWARELGAQVIATLPMLAAFLDEPFDHSPYAPASRLFWNEFYVDVTRAPELAGCPEARALLESQDVRSQIAALQATREVDYRRLMRLKRRMMEPLAKHFFATHSPRRQEFDAYLQDRPDIVNYAEFRAVHDRLRASWHKWPERQRQGILRDSDYDPDTKRYHLYAQWLAHEQVHELGKTMHDAGTKLYLDLPLGVHPDGYDVWRDQDLFLHGLSAGAPPDTVFTHGQSWGFPPLSPRGLREQGYEHFIAVLRHHLRSAGILRIDHVMGLHRLFCIPSGLEAKDGVYVRYPANELYAILAIESHRHEARIVGENLGTVPAYVNKSMSRRGLERMYVAEYEAKPHPRKVFPPVPRNSVASVNTHDMPPFASYWSGLDIEQRQKLGLLDQAGAIHEKKQRQQVCAAVAAFLEQQHWLEHAREENVSAVLEACLAFLSASPARLTLISLEDLWLEKNPQNVPGTANEMPNWQRRMRYAYEEFSCMPSVLTCLESVNSLRKQGRDR